MIRAYDEIIDFIASGATSESVATFAPSEEAKNRVADLIYREKTCGLSPEETAELNHCLQLEQLMRLAKVRAQQYLRSRRIVR